MKLFVELNIVLSLTLNLLAQSLLHFALFGSILLSNILLNVTDPSLTFAEELYRWTDKTGGVYYSNTPRELGDTPVELPEIERENLDRKIKNIKMATPPNCESHGGVDCSQGPDHDGSVICLDHFKGALLPFRFSCLETRLQTSLEISFIGAKGEESLINPKSVTYEYFKQQQAKAVEISVRNLSAVQADGVQVEVRIPGKGTFPALGPSVIKSYGIADYTLSLNMLFNTLEFSSLKNLSFKVTCPNCSAVLRKSR